MTERPILFSGEMVRAILENRKTQTRRVIKPHRGYECHTVCSPGLAADPWAVWFHYSETVRVGHIVECPYGQPGDRLWVRETWGYDWFDDGQSVAYKNIVYRADDGAQPRDQGDPAPWRPAIFMPRWASRITLEITKVRVERLQQISIRDIYAEGLTIPCLDDNPSTETLDAIAIGSWRNLWDQINAKRGFGWDKNPWCWVIEFRRL